MGERGRESLVYKRARKASKALWRLLALFTESEKEGRLRANLRSSGCLREERWPWNAEARPAQLAIASKKKRRRLPRLLIAEMIISMDGKSVGAITTRVSRKVRRDGGAELLSPLEKFAATVHKDAARHSLQRMKNSVRKLDLRGLFYFPSQFAPWRRFGTDNVDFPDKHSQ